MEYLLTDLLLFKPPVVVKKVSKRRKKSIFIQKEVDWAQAQGDLCALRVGLISEFNQGKTLYGFEF